MIDGHDTGENGAKHLMYTFNVESKMLDNLSVMNNASTKELEF